MSNKTAWHDLLISAGLTRNSGMDFNKTGDLFLSKLADSDSPGDAAGLLAEYLGDAPVVQAPDAAAPTIINLNLNFGINGSELTEPYAAEKLIKFINQFKEKLAGTEEKQS
jgi:hypothetical protein